MDKKSKPPSLIPQFYFKPVDRTNIGLVSADLARESFLESCEEDIEVLSQLSDQLWIEIKSLQGEDSLLNYEEFIALSKSLGSNVEKVKRFFSPEVFCRFRADTEGRIKAGAFLDYLSHSVHTTFQYTSISRYDTHGDGYLLEHELETFVCETVASCKLSDEIEEPFLNFYVFHVVRKMMFFLDPYRKMWSRGIRIVDLITSPVFHEFTTQTRVETTEKNWFSVETAKHVYRSYLELDSDNNGLLSQRELGNMNNNSFSNLFVERLFSRKRTFNNEIDYKGFLDLCIAQENTSSPAALIWYWDLLDVDGKGYIDAITIHALFRSVKRKMAVFCNLENEINVEDIIIEIFDMVKPVEPGKIKLKDLLKSGNGQHLVNILSSVDGFWKYEGRDDKQAAEE